MDKSSLPDISSEFENIFKNKKEYILFFTEALGILRGKSKRVDSISSLIPEYIEIDFKHSIKKPRLYFPKDRYNTVIVQIPILKNQLKEQDSMREHKLLTYSAIKGKVEVTIANEFAIRFKLLSKNIKSTVRSRSKKKIKGEK